MKRAYRDYYILKMDIRKYFNSIDKIFSYIHFQYIIKYFINTIKIELIKKYYTKY